MVVVVTTDKEEEQNNRHLMEASSSIIGIIITSLYFMSFGTKDHVEMERRKMQSRFRRWILDIIVRFYDRRCQ
jgi:hypothetical protein